MSYFKSLALTSVVLLPLAVPALAADAIINTPSEPVPVVAVVPQNSWAGGYTGLYLGGGINKFKADAGVNSLKNNNVKFGAYSGWNFQNNKIVYGVEGDAGYNNVKKTDNGLSVKSGFDGSLRGRLGYDLDGVMPYVTAGVAGTQIRVADSTDSSKKFRVGWTAGVGAEALLTNNVTARVEYRYSDFGKKDFALGANAVQGLKLQSHDIRVGVGYKF